MKQRKRLLLVAVLVLSGMLLQPHAAGQTVSGLWDGYLARLAQINARYAEETPGWPAGEPAPRNYIKKELRGMRGNDLLNAVRDGVERVRETHKDAPEEEIRSQIRLVASQGLELYPLLETTNQGYRNLVSTLASVNMDTELRLFLLDNAYPNDAPDTLFALYFREQCRDNRSSILNRCKTMINNVNDDIRMQEAALRAYFIMCRNDVVDALKSDREVARLSKEEGFEVATALLKTRPDIRLAPGTRESVDKALSTLDSFLLGFEDYLTLEENRPEWLRALMLDLFEDAVLEYDLPSAEQHNALLVKMGRGSIDGDTSEE